MSIAKCTVAHGGGGPLTDEGGDVVMAESGADGQGHRLWYAHASQVTARKWSRRTIVESARHRIRSR